MAMGAGSAPASPTKRDRLRGKPRARRGRAAHGVPMTGHRRVREQLYVDARQQQRDGGQRRRVRQTQRRPWRPFSATRESVVGLVEEKELEAR